MKKWLWGFAIVILIGIYYLFNPSSIALFPKCPFLLLTGLKCPGCGSQRAIHSLLHFDLATAFHYNMLLVLSLPFVFVLIYSEIYRQSNTRFYANLHKTKIIYCYLGIVIIWWIIRNIYNL